MLTITANDNKTWSYGYDEVGNKASLTRPNGTATVYDYDSLNRLKGMATRKGTLAQAVAGTSPLVSRFDYHVRADGRRDQLTEAIAHPDGSSVTRTVNYGFDEANRLTSEAGTNGEGKSYSKSYQLDAAGNRLSLVENREGQLYARTTYGYNSLDWLTGTQTQTKDATSNVAYDYDANGAQVSQTTAAGTTGQKWDFEGHLLASGAVNAQGQWSGAKTSYSYDASGMRLTQASWNAAGEVTEGTSYVWDGDRVAEERDEQGVLQAVYEHGQELGPLRLTRRAGTLAAPVEQERYFIGDGQDSTRQLLDENGVVKDSYFYDAFGVGLPGGQGATENSFKYTGQQQDASGLYYLRARYYNAGTGRFLSHDPVMGHSDDPITMHRYLYAGVDPVNGVDPSGRETSILGNTISTSMAATIGGGAIGGAMGAWDTALSGGDWDDVALGAGAGVITGAATGRLSVVKPFAKILWTLGIVGGATGIYDAYDSGNQGLLAFRTVTSAGAFLALVKTTRLAIEQPTPGNVRLQQMAENQARLVLADAEAATANTNAGSLASTLKRFKIGDKGGLFQGKYSAVYNRETGEIKAKPNIGNTEKGDRATGSMPSDPWFNDRDPDYVPRNGGHLMVAEGFGYKPPTPHKNLFGFTFTYRDGVVTIDGWNSGGINGKNYLGDFAGDGSGSIIPPQYRAEIAGNLWNVTGERVVIAP